jgi:protein phosphatase
MCGNTAKMFGGPTGPRNAHETSVTTAIVSLPGACLAFAFVALLVWFLLARRRPVPPPAAKAAQKKPSLAPKKRTPEAAPRPEQHSIPHMADEEGDDIEVTAVTASPAAPAGADPAGKTSANPDASMISMIYEDDDAAVEEVTSPIARILVSAQGQSDRGRVRRKNEDSLLVLPERSVFVVADGMGGYAGGSVASKLAVDTIRGAFDREVFEGLAESKTPVPRRGMEMALAIQMANQAIIARAQMEKELAEMGTTVVAARFSPNKQRVYIGHVGDSRSYRFRSRQLTQLTTDHTLGLLGVKGPGSAHLFQAVGRERRMLIDVIVDKPRTDDVYLLCSDGLSKMVPDEAICDTLRNEPDLEAAVAALIQEANERGGRDNVTVIMVKVLERVPQHRAP